MAIDFESGFVFNAIFWLASPRPNETTIVDRMIDDVTVVCTVRGIPFHPHFVPTGDGLFRALSEIEAAAQRGLRPVIYLDMHGSAEDGVEIAATGEMLAWDKVVDALRRINRATGNNLLVVAGVCYGLHAIKESMITDHAPFFMLAAPEERITFGELEDQTFPFFDELTTTLNFDSAKAKLSPKMKVFHCMRVFTVAMARYIHRQCRGKGAAERREALLTEVLASGAPLPPGGLPELRRQIKEGIRPTQDMLDRYAARFLGGKPLGYDLEGLLALLEAAGDAR